MTSIEPRDVVQRYFDALATGDQEVIWTSWAEDGTCWYGGDLPISGMWRGREQVINGFLATAFAHLDPDHEIGVRTTNMICEGSQVVVEWDSWATGKTGRAYDQKNIAVFVVENDRIVSMREYADTQNWERALVTQGRSGDPGAR
jgi:ketosteroid isomerase-like protein